MTNRDAMFGFLAGAIAGAAVAILYTPQSGEETRQRLRQTGRDVSAKSVEAGQTAKQAAIETVDEVKTRVSAAASQVAGKANRVATAVERGKEAFHASLSDA